MTGASQPRPLGAGSAANPLHRVGVLSFAHYHANFWSEVFAGRGALD